MEPQIDKHEAAMQNNGHSPQQNSPGKPLRLSRDFVLHVGKLPELRKGEMTWLLIGSHWYAAEVVSRLPGGVYRVQLSESLGGAKRYVLHCGNFGGKW